MKTEFRLLGLNRCHNEHYMSATLEPIGKEGDYFHSYIKGTNETKEGMWNYCTGNWGDKKIAIVEHDGLSNGIPNNPLVIEIRES